MQYAQDHLTDHSIIRMGDDQMPGERFTPFDALRFHQQERGFIAAELAQEFNGLPIVATHHAATISAIKPIFVGDKLSPAYASNLDDLVLKADFWASGHTHHPVDLTIGKCRYVSWPRGYVRGGQNEVATFRWPRVWEVE